MPLPFIALSPIAPRVVEVPYYATTKLCADCTDCSDQSDSTDSSDATDITDDMI